MFLYKLRKYHHFVSSRGVRAVARHFASSGQKEQGSYWSNSDTRAQDDDGSGGDYLFSAASQNSDKDDTTTTTTKNNTQQALPDSPIQPQTALTAQPQADTSEFDYDVAVIGGGSGGLACCLEARRLGLRVVLFDYVEPSPRGTRWGLGGTCVNVGCIPKKFLHLAGETAETIVRARDFGFALAENRESGDGGSDGDSAHSAAGLQRHRHVHAAFSWSLLVQNIHDYVQNTSFFYESLLAERGVQYVNAFAGVLDGHTVVTAESRGDLAARIAALRLGVPEHEKDITGRPAASTTTSITTHQPRKTQYRAKYIVLATGTRPSYDLSVPCTGLREHAITSDDVFRLARAPGKTLVVGGGYIALELAGALASLGYPVTVMTRGKWLRGFDQEMVSYIVRDLQNFQRVRMLSGWLPVLVEDSRGGSGEGGHSGSGAASTAIAIAQHLLHLGGIGHHPSDERGHAPPAVTRPSQHRYTVTAERVAATSEGDARETITTTAEQAAPHVIKDYFDTVVMAVGRRANLAGMGLDGLVTMQDGKVVGYGGRKDAQARESDASAEQTSVASIFAVGDLLHAQPELTSVAVKQGRVLARRLAQREGLYARASAPSLWSNAHSGSGSAPQPFETVGEVDWQCVPTTVFTPTEYSCVGLSEDAARAQLGADGVVVYHSSFPMYEDALYTQYDFATMRSFKRRGFAKIVADARDGRVLGVHYYGLHSGEAMQGFAVALATRRLTLDLLLNRALGIHPVNSEELVNLTVAKPGNPERLGC